MTTTRIVLNVHGGVVQDVFSSDPAVQVILCDWDSDGQQPSDPGYFEVSDENGRRQPAYVAEYPVNPWSDLMGTDVERALEVSGVLHGTA